MLKALVNEMGDVIGKADVNEDKYGNVEYGGDYGGNFMVYGIAAVKDFGDVMEEYDFDWIDNLTEYEV